MLTVLPLSSHPLLIVIDSDKDAAIALGYNILDSPLFVLSTGLVVVPLGTMLLPRFSSGFGYLTHFLHLHFSYLPPSPQFTHFPQLHK